MVDQLETDYDMVKNKAIYAVASTIKELDSHKNMHMKYKPDFYNTKEKEICDLFLEYTVTVM